MRKNLEANFQCHITVLKNLAARTCKLHSVRVSNNSVTVSRGCRARKFVHKRKQLPPPPQSRIRSNQPDVATVVWAEWTLLQVAACKAATVTESPDEEGGRTSGLRLSARRTRRSVICSSTVAGPSAAGDYVQQPCRPLRASYP
jgi:hypothetical protein